jgi:threonine dehydrogenase-like Zn-dependent dehydrogenase
MPCFHCAHESAQFIDKLLDVCHPEQPVLSEAEGSEGSALPCGLSRWEKVLLTQGRHDVVIVGGGIIGLAVALACAPRRWIAAEICSMTSTLSAPETPFMF